MIDTPAGTVVERLLEPIGRSMSVELARELVALRVSPDDQARIDELAEKCNEGRLSDEEREEYAEIVHAIHVIGLLQARARDMLRDGSHP
jgi:hypothetical protein